MKKVVVFDVDGTLFDTKIGIINTFRCVLKDFDVSLDGIDEDSLIGPPVKKIFLEWFGMSEESATYATHLYRKNYVEKYVSESNLYRNAKKIIEFMMSKDVVMCIATMKTLPQVEKLMEISGLRSCFSTIMTAREDGSLSKSQMLLQIKEKYGEAIYYMVGDTQGDLDASINANMNFIYAKYGYGNILDTKDMFVIKDLLEIKNVLCDEK